jgi:2-oxoglutarate ferredoxin oxidoreductase subunit delta
MSHTEERMPANEPRKDGVVWTYEDDKTRIVVNRKWCKGCDVCVAFCPQETLAMESEKVVVVKLETCTRCMLCELRCPDFAIDVVDLSKEAAGGSKG